MSCEPLHRLPSAPPVISVSCPPVDASTRGLAAVLMCRLADPRLGVPAAIAFLARLAAQHGPGWVRHSLPTLLNWLAEPCVAVTEETPLMHGNSRTAYQQWQRLTRRQQAQPWVAGVAGCGGAAAEAASAAAPGERDGSQSGCSGNLVLRPRLLSLPAQLQPQLRQLLAAVRRCPSFYDNLDERGRAMLQYLLASLQSDADGSVGVGGEASGVNSGNISSNKNNTAATTGAGWAKAWVSAALRSSRHRYQRSVRHPASAAPVTDPSSAATMAATVTTTQLPGRDDNDGGGGLPACREVAPLFAVDGQFMSGAGGYGDVVRGTFWLETRCSTGGTALDGGVDVAVAGVSGTGVPVSTDGWWWIPMPPEACDERDCGDEADGRVGEQPRAATRGSGLTEEQAHSPTASGTKRERGAAGGEVEGELAAPAAPWGQEGLEDDDGGQPCGRTRAQEMAAGAATAAAVSEPVAKRPRRSLPAVGAAAALQDVADPPQPSRLRTDQTGEKPSGILEHHVPPPSHGAAAAAASAGGDTASFERTWAEVIRLLKDAIGDGRSGDPSWQHLESLLERCAASGMLYTTIGTAVVAATTATTAAAASPAAAEGPLTLALPPDGLLYIVRHLLTPRLSGAAARLLLAATALPAVAAVERVMPKPLLDALTAAAGPHPRPLTEAVLAPAAGRPGLTAGQAQLLIKACSTAPNALPRPLQALVLRAAAAVGADWAEAHVALVQGLVEAARRELDVDTLAAVVHGLCAGARSPSLLRSASLWRLLLSVLAKYGTVLHAVQLRQLYDAASATTNFMTKPCLSKLRELLDG